MAADYCAFFPVPSVPSGHFSRGTGAARDEFLIVITVEIARRTRFHARDSPRRPFFWMKHRGYRDVRDTRRTRSHGAAAYRVRLSARVGVSRRERPGGSLRLTYARGNELRRK